MIFVISILAALLLPALQNARYLAKNIVCLNNVKQIASGKLMYAGDFDAWYPYRGVDMKGRWPHRLQATGNDVDLRKTLIIPYFDDVTSLVFVCPLYDATGQEPWSLDKFRKKVRPNFPFDTDAFPCTVSSGHRGCHSHGAAHVSDASESTGTTYSYYGGVKKYSSNGYSPHNNRMKVGQPYQVGQNAGSLKDLSILVSDAIPKASKLFALGSDHGPPPGYEKGELRPANFAYEDGAAKTHWYSGWKLTQDDWHPVGKITEKRMFPKE